MGTYKEVKSLEERMFQLMCDTGKAMFLMNKEGVRTGLATTKLLNDEYKKITQTDYVKPDYFEKQYTKLQNGCL